MWKIQHKLLIWLAALGSNILGLTWLVTYFTGTDHTHTGMFMLVVGIGALLLALGLYLLLKEAVITLVAVAITTLGLGLKELITGPESLRIIWALVIFIAIIYLALLIPPIIRNYVRSKQEDL